MESAVQCWTGGGTASHRSHGLVTLEEEEELSGASQEAAASGLMGVCRNLAKKAALRQ